MSLASRTTARRLLEHVSMCCPYVAVGVLLNPDSHPLWGCSIGKKQSSHNLLQPNAYAQSTADALRRLGSNEACIGGQGVCGLVNLRSAFSQ